MSMAEDTRKRPDLLTDSYPPKAKDPASDPLAELARLIGQNDPFAEPARKPLDTLRPIDRAAPESAAAPGGAAAPGTTAAPEWLARPAASHGDEQDYEPRPPVRDSYAQHGGYDQADQYPEGDYRAGEEPAAYAPQPTQAQAHSYRPLASVFAADGAQSQRHQAAAAEGERDGY